jgi:hypothetical protein
VQTTGEAAEDDEAGAFEAGALALAPMQGPPPKRQKTVLTVSALLVPGDMHVSSSSHDMLVASLVPGDAGRAAAPGEYRAIATAVTKSQLCSAAAAAPLLEGVSEQQRPESPVQPKG